MDKADVATQWSVRTPTSAVGIADETGSLAVGKRADMVWVDTSMPVPRVLTTFVAGRQIYGLA